MSNQVASTILSQINSLDFWARARWGFSGAVGRPDGVKLYVARKREVVVTLAADDTYTVTVGRVVRYDWKSIKEVSGVYADSLVRVIDEVLS